MDRRTFLRFLGAAGAGATLDRKYFFAPAAGWLPDGYWIKFSTEPLLRGDRVPSVYVAQAEFSREEIARIFDVPVHLLRAGPSVSRLIEREVAAAFQRAMDSVIEQEIQGRSPGDPVGLLSILS